VVLVGGLDASGPRTGTTGIAAGVVAGVCLVAVLGLERVGGATARAASSPV